MKVTIPASIEEAVSKLNGIERLLMATEWEKAAIIAAFVAAEESGGRPKATTSSRFLNVTQFAALGITGLRSKDTVRRYVEAWGDRAKPLPGHVVVLPTVEFPTVKTKAQDIAQQPGAVAKAMEDPAFAKKVMDRATPKAVQSAQKAANEAASTIPSDEWDKMRDKHDAAEKHREGKHPLSSMDLMDLSKDILAAANKVEKIVLDNATLDPDAVEFTKVNIIEAIGVLTGVVRSLTGNADWDSALAELSK